MNDPQTLQLIHAGSLIGIAAVLLTVLGRWQAKGEMRQRVLILIGIYPSLPILIPLLLGLDHPLTFLLFVAGIIGVGGIIEYSTMEAGSVGRVRLMRVEGFILIGLLAAGSGIALLGINYGEEARDLQLAAISALFAAIVAGGVAVTRLHGNQSGGEDEQERDDSRQSNTLG